MKQRKYEKLPMDPELRAHALRIIESYKTKTSTNVGGSAGDIWADELVPAMMNAISRLIVAYDNNELSPTLQRKLFRMMKRIVAKYPG
jgi:hypothetical protein